MTHSLFAVRLADATQRGLEREVGERPRNERRIRMLLDDRWLHSTILDLDLAEQEPNRDIQQKGLVNRSCWRVGDIFE
jgi:hypothetical protein